MKTDARILALRKLARSHGWSTRSVSAAKRRARIDLVCERVYREPWTAKNMSQHAQLQKVDVYVGDDGLVAFNSYDSGRYSTRLFGLDAIEGAIVVPVPKEGL